MNILDRYLYRTVLLYTAMAMAVLLTLGALFLFISQQSDIGVGSYSAGDAFLFTLLNLPQQAFELLPIGAMIGALMGLGNLASGSELVVTRASGVSVWRIAWPVGLAGLTLALIMYGIGEYAAPPMAQFAKARKDHEQIGGRELRGLEQRMGEGREPDPAGANRRGRPTPSAACRCSSWMDRRSYARFSEPRGFRSPDPGRWRLHNVATSTFSADHMQGSLVGERTMQSTVNPEFLGLAATDPAIADAARPRLVYRSSAAQ